MKAKLYICAALAAATIGFTSCESMLKVDSKVVLYAEDNTLDNATDTLYSVMGIINGLQKIADRTVILNEMRGGLVTVTDHATDDLNEIYKFDFANVSEGNRYDRPVDYYSVINNCNYFLAHADTAYQRAGKSVFLPEYIAVLCYRAWTYLQLASVYGEVPFVTKPILSETEAYAGNYPRLNAKQIAQELLKDFKEEYAFIDMPKYGSLGGGTNGDGTTSASHKAEDLFIPYRIMWGDLFLWAEKYDSAAIEYYEFLTDEDDPVFVGTGSILWLGPTFEYLGEDSYAGMFGEKQDAIAYIPMESEKYGGVVSDLENVFSSTKDNDFWNQATRSNALTYLSENQTYCYHKINEQSEVVVPTKMSQDIKDNLENELYRGDLRLQSILTIKAADANNDEEEGVTSLITNDKRQTLKKINKEKICLYRSDVVYLRLAEALNRAGLPQMAFYVLKCGLCDDTFYDGTSYKGIAYSPAIADNYNEYRKAIDLGVYYWDYSEFQLVIRQRVNLNNFQKQNINGHKTPADYVEYYAETGQGARNRYLTMGIHSRGCGNADIDSLYRINVPAGAALEDSIRAVEEMIVDEMALETCFEGYRFSDLLRISIHRASDTQSESYGGFAENDFLASRVAARDAATYNDYKATDAALYQTLRGSDVKKLNMEWFLRLPDVK